MSSLIFSCAEVCICDHSNIVNCQKEEAYHIGCVW